MSIFVAFLSVSCVNVPLSWASEFIKVDCLLVVVNDHNVRLLCSHTKLRRNRTSSWCSVPWQVAVHCVLFINRVHNVIDHTIVSPGETTTVQCNFANTQHMVCGLSTSAQFAQIRGRLLPHFEICSSWEGINTGIVVHELCQGSESPSTYYEV